MNEQGLYDIYGTLHIPFWQTTWFYWLVGTLILLMFLGIAWHLYQRSAEKKEILNPYQKAIAGIQELQARKVNNRQQAQNVYFDLTNILKEYIQNSLGYPVVGLTDSELLSYLTHNYIPAQANTQLRDICNGCLYVKFAQESVLQEHIDQDLAKSLDIIEKIEEHLRLKNA